MKIKYSYLLVYYIIVWMGCDEFHPILAGIPGIHVLAHANSNVSMHRTVPHRIKYAINLLSAMDRV